MSFLALAIAFKKIRSISETCAKWLRFGAVSETWGLANSHIYCKTQSSVKTRSGPTLKKMCNLKTQTKMTRVFPAKKIISMGGAVWGPGVNVVKPFLQEIWII